MYEKITICPICKNTNFTDHLVCTDHLVSGEKFTLVRCNECTLIFTNPKPNGAILHNYYKSDQYISHTNKANSFINLIYKIVKKYTIGRKVRMISKYSAKGKILDYGCGTGHFLHACEKKGWDSFGYEPDIKAQKTANQKGLNLIKDLKSLKEKVDLITAWHVIEHVSELKKTIRDLVEKLIPAGYMIIALPNPDSFDAEHYQEYWAGYDVPRHLYHFNRKSFGKLMADNKLQIVDILPMKFDSYYVSILSEKYKNGRMNFFKALKIGRQSNNIGKRKGEYSSLIYILKK